MPMPLFGPDNCSASTRAINDKDEGFGYLRRPLFSDPQQALVYTGGKIVHLAQRRPKTRRMPRLLLMITRMLQLPYAPVLPCTIRMPVITLCLNAAASGSGSFYIKSSQY